MEKPAVCIGLQGIQREAGGLEDECPEDWSYRANSIYGMSYMPS